MKCFLLCTAVLLSGCQDQEESRAKNEKLLPPGCIIIDLDYGDLRAAVVCDGRHATTTVRRWSQLAGKVTTTRRAAVAVIGSTEANR